MGKATVPVSPLFVLKRHALLALSTFISVTVGASILTLASSPRLYESSARLIVGEKGVGISDLGQALTDNSTAVPGKTADPVAIQAELLESQKVLQRALHNYQKENKIPLEQLPSIEELHQALKVDIVPATSILEVSLKLEDPKLAAGLLNAIAQAMVAENSESIRAEASVVRKFLEERIPRQEAILQETELAESRYREATGIVSLDTQTQSLVNELASLEDEERKLRAQYQEATTRNNLLRRVTGANTPTDAYAAVRVGQDENLQALQKQLTELDVAIIDARSRLGDQHPDLLALLQKRDELRALYTQQLARTTGGRAASSNLAPNPLSQDLMSRYIASEIDRRALESSLRIAQSELTNLRERVYQMPSYQPTLANLARKRDEAETALKMLQDKLEQARIAEKQLINNVRIVGAAQVPIDPVSPKPLAIIALSTVAGLIVAGALVLLLELLDATLRDPGEAESVLGLPVLGVLPKTASATLTPENLEAFLDEPDNVEPYRALLKTLDFLGEQTSQAIVVSSVVAGEGKSVVALHLAAVAAILSRHTLIIDADLRNPLQHHLLDVPASPGLAEVIRDKYSWLNAVRPTAIENLSILPAGKFISRPSTLIETVEMKELLKEVANHYDYVIVTASPVKTCADAATLSQAASGLVLVTQLHATPKESILWAISNLRKNGVLPLGLVMNEAGFPLEEKPPALPPAVELRQLPSSYRT
ncbi:MAG TPA: polysaccharide biosynthesis tyrosine autokinase [Crinalium sp.]|jgi:capsular exopolysaccharide synthesis family protein